MCNLASIATVTHRLPEPTSTYPRGTQERTGIEELMSDEEFQRGEVEIEAGLSAEASEKPEAVLRSRTAERETQGEQQESRDGESRGKEADNENRRKRETGVELYGAPKSSREPAGKHGGSRHVPGVAWHSQVRLYLKLNFLPGGRKSSGAEGRTGERSCKEGEVL
ncbi:hypothetical protein NDU88_006393 [Pleurodeles waltl]|uniref:Uncharacterized protein n=1 Tax=Pleurodeles waltl TaxID=8319 RepID=A0AAV7X1F0_PLEWA|nr:hypothetical protein NDU88_006393 [Pleurodeles waltl]